MLARLVEEDRLGAELLAPVDDRDLAGVAVRNSASSTRRHHAGDREVQSLKNAPSQRRSTNAAAANSSSPGTSNLVDSTAVMITAGRVVTVVGLDELQAIALPLIAFDLRSTSSVRNVRLLLHHGCKLAPRIERYPVILDQLGVEVDRPGLPSRRTARSRFRRIERRRQPGGPPPMIAMSKLRWHDGCTPRARLYGPSP